jgi:hypothetical protein
MTKWLLIGRQQFSENTPEYGHGDWPDQIDYIKAVVEADDKRAAQRAFRKLFPGILFSGVCAPMLITADDPYAYLYTKPADIRLSRAAVHAHRAALEALR